MQQGGPIYGAAYNWSLFGVNTNSIFSRDTFNLKGIVDETLWHTYNIIWRADTSFLYLDENLLFTSTLHNPNDKMRVDIWIDNRVIDITNPFVFLNNNSTGSVMLVDFVEVSGINGPSIPRTPSGIIKIWDSPNTHASGKVSTLWKEYEFNTTTAGKALVFITGNAESYGTVSDDDDLKVVLDDIDSGWNTASSLDGNIINGTGSSIVLTSDISASDHKLQLFSDVTPFLRDAIVLFSENGQVLINETYNQTKTNGDGLWKTISFDTYKENEIIFLLSGTGFSGDQIKVEIDGTDYLWTGENAIDGNELDGIPKTVVIKKVIPPGNHVVNIYETGKPKLFSVACYGVKISYVNLNAFLEGSYSNNTMVSSIVHNDDFPMSQPFNASPWNYKGEEEINITPPNIIDWVLIELRDNQTTPTKQYFRAALLNKFGNIVDIDGGNLKFVGINPGNYYCAVYHRNHLPILSSVTIPIE